MEESWEYWLSHLGMSSSEVTATTTTSAGRFEEFISFKGHQFCDVIIPNNNNNNNNNNSEAKKEDKKMENNNIKDGELLELEGIRNEKRGRKKGRSSSEVMDHIMSERKRRQQMAERFIALSATIPGLKKIDKASVLEEAINYVKQLQQRIAELEQQETNNKKKKNTESLIIVTKSDSNTRSGSSCATTNLNQDDVEEEDDEVVVVVPEVEAREIEKELLIRIHCENRNGIMRKLLALLETNHLSVTSSCTLPFGNSALNIIIIARMTKEFSITVNDLVKTLKKYLLKFMK